MGHPKVDQICTTLARYGIHPKMTGAGGGGSVFAFLKPDTPPTLLDMISQELTKLGYEVGQPLEEEIRSTLPGMAASFGRSRRGGTCKEAGALLDASPLDDV